MWYLRCGTVQSGQQKSFNPVLSSEEPKQTQKIPAGIRTLRPDIFDSCRDLFFETFSSPSIPGLQSLKYVSPEIRSLPVSLPSSVLFPSWHRSSLPPQTLSDISALRNHLSPLSPAHLSVSGQACNKYCSSYGYRRENPVPLQSENTLRSSGFLH